jgi:hypothetical protein
MTFFIKPCLKSEHTLEVPRILQCPVYLVKKIHLGTFWGLLGQFEDQYSQGFQHDEPQLGIEQQRVSAAAECS